MQRSGLPCSGQRSPKAVQTRSPGPKCAKQREKPEPRQHEARKGGIPAGREWAFNEPVDQRVRVRQTYERLFGRDDRRLTVEFFDYTLQEVGDGVVAIGRERGTVEGPGLRLDIAIRTTRLLERLPRRVRLKEDPPANDCAHLPCYPPRRVGRTALGRGRDVRRRALR